MIRASPFFSRVECCCLFAFFCSGVSTNCEYEKNLSPQQRQSSHKKLCEIQFVYIFAVAHSCRRRREPTEKNNIISNMLISHCVDDGMIRQPVSSREWAGERSRGWQQSLLEYNKNNNQVSRGDFLRAQLMLYASCTILISPTEYHSDESRSEGKKGKKKCKRRVESWVCPLLLAVLIPTLAYFSHTSLVGCRMTESCFIYHSVPSMRVRCGTTSFSTHFLMILSANDVHDAGGNEPLRCCWRSIMWIFLHFSTLLCVAPKILHWHGKLLICRFSLVIGA